jgi:DNA polymerase IV
MNSWMPDTLCRDCLEWHEGAAAACCACGSGRLVTAAGLAGLTIAHVDCDAFFAAIEKRDNPALKDRPVIVGGGRRGVVATCCYIARLYGVRSAMPMFQALKACPEAVVIQPDGAKYRAAAALIRTKMDMLTPLVQPVSIDEAYLDLGGTAALHGAPPATLLARLAHAIERDVGITVSVGLSSNKFLAKTASELDKPRGFAAISPDSAESLLADKPVAFLHGVGPKFAARLQLDRFETVADLQRSTLKELIQRYGDTGLWLKNRAHGRDTRPVRNDDIRKSVSSETTFFEDTSDTSILEDHLWRLSVKTADRAKAAGVVGAVLTLKLKTARFRQLTRRVCLHEPTQLAQAIFRAARPLLAQETAGCERYRLIGVGLSELSAPRADAGDLIDPLIAKRAAAERASDAARAKFGSDAVMTGRSARLSRRETHK